MKIALLATLSLFAGGLTLVSAVPEAAACYDHCRVGPCDVYRGPALFTVYVPVVDRERDVDDVYFTCGVVSPASPDGLDGFGRCEIQWQGVGTYEDPLTGESRDLYAPTGYACYW